MTFQLLDTIVLTATYLITGFAAATSAPWWKSTSRMG